MSKISMHIEHRIRNLRKKKGYTIEEFSKIINKSKATLSKYENGSISMDIDTILEIAEALEVEIDYLINYKSPRVNKTSLIQDKDMVFLDVSTSNLAIAELLMKSAVDRKSVV